MVQGAHKKFLKNNSLNKPSATATPLIFRKWQAQRTQAISCERPRTYKDPIPTTLLHPIFGQFIKDTRNIQLTTNDNELTMDLAGAMSALYTDESKWAKKIKDILETYNVHFSITKIKVTGYETDSDISTQNYRYVVVEFKNEAGNTSGEPYFQTIGYYLESTRLDAPKMPNSPLPCLLLSMSWHDTWLHFAKLSKH